MDDLISYGRPVGEGLSLHLGCGDYWRRDSINIDHAVFAGTDMLWDLREKLPFQDKTVKYITSGDFIEHFTPTEIDTMLDDWYRLLIAGGVVHAVVPDIEELMKQGLINQIYGIENDHKWGYTVETFAELFKKHGFSDITVEKKEFSHRPGEPKLEIFCRKEEK